jgi:hypothetical protein
VNWDTKYNRLCQILDMHFATTYRVCDDGVKYILTVLTGRQCGDGLRSWVIRKP